MPKPTPVAIAAAKKKSFQIKALFAFAAVAIAILILAITLAAQVFAKPSPQEKAVSEPAPVDQPIELGDVRWLRDLDTAVSDSKKQNKPIAILFQEVPG